MTIYDAKPISQNIINKFKPTRLYIKRHTKTGIRYLGKYTKENILEYRGSGTHWNRHIKFHGKHLVVTDWVSDWFEDPSVIQEFALFLSKEFDVVGSREWANKRPEDGLEGGGPGHSSDQMKNFLTDPKVKEKMSGTNHYKYDHTIYTFTNKDGRVESLTQHEFGKKFNIRRSLVNALVRHRKRSHLGWFVGDHLKKRPAPNKDKQLYNFYHKDSDTLEKCDRHEFKEKYNLGRYGICQIIKGRNIPYRGWIVLSE